jgi:hypothetical protein
MNTDQAHDELNGIVEGCSRAAISKRYDDIIELLQQGNEKELLMLNSMTYKTIERFVEANLERLNHGKPEMAQVGREDFIDGMMIAANTLFPECPRTST